MNALGKCRQPKLFVMFLSLIWQISCFATAPNKCVQIFYDNINPAYHEGRAAALTLENLLAHFPNIQRYVAPIELYKKDQLNHCYASFYLGTISNDAIPADFLLDFVSTKKNVIWLQDNIWKLNPTILQNLWGVKLTDIASLDWQNHDKNGQPGFYRFFLYKGQVFNSYGNYDESDPKQFIANYRLFLMELLNDKAKNNVVAWAKHSTNNQLAPFVLHNNNHWYLAQNPFSYKAKDSQYLIFTDLLFDMVGEPPRYKDKRPALVRIEDVNIGFHTPEQIMALTDLFAKYHAPFAIAVIPIYADPFNVLRTKIRGPLVEHYGFLYAFHYAKEHGASFIFEGVTHQYSNVKNPYNGLTGADYEFWDEVNNLPIKEDSPLYILKKLQIGADALADAEIKPAAWLTPHYRASILDYVIFAQLFNWAVESKYYVPCKIEQKSKLPAQLNFDNYWPGSVEKRLPYFESLTVTYDKSIPLDQPFFPYELYGDYYGQRVMPENAGYITPEPGLLVNYYETVDDMIKIIQRNTVIRDAWASFFIHPVLVNTKAKGGIAKFPGDTSDLERLISAIQKAGYQFIDLNSWTKEHMEMAPPTIEVTQ